MLLSMRSYSRSSLLKKENMKTRLKPGNETLRHARGLLYVRLESVDDKTFPSPEVRKSVFPGLFLCVVAKWKIASRSLTARELRAL